MPSLKYCEGICIKGELLMNKEDFEKLRQQAREANLVSYFQQSGYTVEQHGKEYYTSLCF